MADTRVSVYHVIVPLNLNFDLINVCACFNEPLHLESSVSPAVIDTIDSQKRFAIVVSLPLEDLMYLDTRRVFLPPISFHIHTVSGFSGHRAWCILFYDKRFLDLILTTI